MTDCCEAEPVVPIRENEPNARVLCPLCGSLGSKVDRQTVLAMVAVTLERVQAPDYRFCRSAGCPVVYYAADGSGAFTVKEVRERVYQKAPADETVWVCYCFQHTAANIRASADPAGHSNIVEWINTGIRAGLCACDLRNPQGVCCLGNVRALVKRAAMEFTG